MSGSLIETSREIKTEQHWKVYLPKYVRGISDFSIKLLKVNFKETIFSCEKILYASFFCK